MNTEIYESFIQLVRLGIGIGMVNDSILTVHAPDDWQSLKALAVAQGLSAVVLDALSSISDNLTETMPVQMKLEWIGEVLQSEFVHSTQQKTAETMAQLFHNNNIRTYVLKGAVVAECYPNPQHRYSVDLDCFLKPNKGIFDACLLGNNLVKGKGYQVDTDFYKNSTFHLPGLIVENHKYLTPFRANKILKRFETLLQSLLAKDEGQDRFDGAWLYRPSMMVSALLLIEHAYSHFLHEGLTWRMILDWGLFNKKHEEEIDWSVFDEYIDEFGFRNFYGSYVRLGDYLLGGLSEEALTKTDRLMLADIWAPLDLHDSVRGVNGKLALVGNTWRARWKYRYFTEMNWVSALWIQVKGFLFEKDPKMN